MSVKGCKHFTGGCGKEKQNWLLLWKLAAVYANFIFMHKILLTCMFTEILLIYTWIGNADYYALKFMIQSLLRDVTIYSTKLWKLWLPNRIHL